MATPLPARGEVTFYAYDVMERAYHRRLELAQVPYCDKPTCVGYVATLRPGDLGRKVWLMRPGMPPEGPFLVVDYAAASDFARLDRRGVRQIELTPMVIVGHGRPVLPSADDARRILDDIYGLSQRAASR